MSPEAREKQDDMSKQLREVRSEDLVVGKEYYDTPVINSMTCVLRFIGMSDFGNLRFEYVSGKDAYSRLPDGKILLSDVCLFYEEAQ